MTALSHLTTPHDDRNETTTGGVRLHHSLVASILAAGVNGGIFAAFSLIILPALNQRPDRDAVAVMQAINVAAITPAFMTVLFGGAALTAAVGGWALTHRDRPGSAWIIAASATFLVTVIAVTMVGNVPLNDHLATLSPQSARAGAEWARFEHGWAALNLVRTAGGVVSCLLFAVAYRRSHVRRRSDG